MLISASDEDLIEKLVAVRGLGRWSVGTWNHSISSPLQHLELCEDFYKMPMERTAADTLRRWR